MSEWSTVAALADGCLPDLALDADGAPGRALVFVDLSGAEPAAASPAAAAADAALPLLVGVTDRLPDAALAPLLRALDVTLTTQPGDDPTCVRVPDLAAARAGLDDAVARSPRAAVVVGRLLRSTDCADVRAGLAAEAAAYSMLLGGPEMARWLAERGAPRPHAPSRTPPVAVERTDSTLRVTLQRPERRNAMDAALREALVDALSVAVADPEVRVELSGAGPGFCSGGDLDEFGTATDYVAAYLVRLDRHPGWLLHRLRERSTVRVHGACIGAGVEIAAFAGTVVASPDAWCTLPEVAMGLVPGAGGTVSIPRRVGRWRTAWMALTGARVDARTALEWGLVDRIEQ